MFRRLLLNLAFATVLLAPAAHSQTNDAPPTAATAENSTYSDADDAKYRELWTNTFFDELIYNVSAQIEALPAAERVRPDPRLLWFRGMAFYQLGHLPEAKADLIASKNDGRKTYGVEEKLKSIEKLAALLPPKTEEIREGERVIFRAHYFGMGGGTASVLTLLPNAYRISRQMFGSDVAQTTVCIFDTFDQFRAYYTEVRGEQAMARLGSWVWALAQGDVVLICLQNPDGESVSSTNRQYFVNTIVHEFNHVMFSRLMGYSSQPRWFVEGLAQVAESRSGPDLRLSKKRTLRRLFANNTLISLEELENYDKFNVQVEAGIASRKDKDFEAAPDPYTQGYGMTQYLLANTTTPQLQSFLNRTRESKDFDASFAAEFGFSVEQFYASWKRDTARELGVR